MLGCLDRHAFPKLLATLRVASIDKSKQKKRITYKTAALVSKDWILCHKSRMSAKSIATRYMKYVKTTSTSMHLEHTRASEVYHHQDTGEEKIDQS